MQVDPNKS